MPFTWPLWVALVPSIVVQQSPAVVPLGSGLRLCDCHPLPLPALLVRLASQLSMSYQVHTFADCHASASFCCTMTPGQRERLADPDGAAAPGGEDVRHHRQGRPGPILADDTGRTYMFVILYR